MIERAVVGVVYQTDQASVAKVGQEFAASVQGFGVKAASAISAGAFAAAGALGAMTLAAAQQGDAAAKMARELGISVEAYTALTFAADRSGVSQSQLETGLRGVTARLAAASQGSAEAARAFEDYGVAIRDESGALRTAADLLPSIADALAAIPDPGERSAAAVRLMGESGGRMAVLLGGGAEALDELTAAAQRNGAVLSAESTENSEALVDAMTDLRAVVGGLARVLTDAMTPGLTVLVEQLTAWLSASEGIARQGLDRVARGISLAMDALATDAGKAVAAVAGLATVVGGAGQVGSLVGSLGPLGSALTGVAGSLATMGKAVALPALVIVGLALALEDLYVAATGGDAAIIRLADAFGVGAEAASILGGAFRFLSVGFDNWMFLAGEGIALTYDLGVAFLAAADSGLEMAARLFPPLERLRDLIQWLLGAAGGGIRGALGAIGAGLNAAADQGSFRTASTEGLEMTGLGALVASAQQRAATGEGNLSAIAPLQAAGAQGVAQGISVSIGAVTGSSLAEAAAAAGRAVTDAVLAQAGAIEDLS